MNKNNENTNAFLIHFSAFAGYLFPFEDIIAPFVLWQVQKNKSIFLDEQGKEAVNFNISYLLYIILIILLVIPLIIIGLGIFGVYRIFINIVVISFIKIPFIIIAALKSKERKNYNNLTVILLLNH